MELSKYFNMIDEEMRVIIPDILGRLEAFLDDDKVAIQQHSILIDKELKDIQNFLKGKAIEYSNGTDQAAWSNAMSSLLDTNRLYVYFIASMKHYAYMKLFVSNTNKWQDPKSVAKFYDSLRDMRVYCLLMFAEMKDSMENDE